MTKLFVVTFLSKRSLFLLTFAKTPLVCEFSTFQNFYVVIFAFSQLAKAKNVAIIMKLERLVPCFSSFVTIVLLNWLFKYFLLFKKCKREKFHEIENKLPPSAVHCLISDSAKINIKNQINVKN